MMGSITQDQRHSRANPCLACRGFDGAARGVGKRCHGYRSGDGKYDLCSREDHAGLINVNGAGLFAHRLRGTCDCGTSHGPTELHVVPERRTHVYYTRDGQRQLRVTIEGHGQDKVTYQSHFDSTTGTFVKGGVPRADLVLYGLTEILAADLETEIFFVEGERDVETARALGVVATTNPMGAGKFHMVAKHAGDVLRGRPVTVLADADKPGRNHALDVVNGLTGIAKSITLRECPPPHKDLTDLIHGGGSIADLIEIPPTTPSASDASEIFSNDDADTAESSDPPPSAALLSLSDRRTVVTDAWLRDVPPAPSYLLFDSRTGKGALASHGVTLLVSAGGVGKSFSALWLVLAIATREVPWLGVLRAQPRHGRSLIVSAEDSGDELRQRAFYVAKSLGLKSVPDDSIEILDLHDRHFPLLDKDGVRTANASALIAYVKQNGPYDVVLGDPLGKLAGANIDADNGAAGALLALLGEIGSSADGSFIGLHHTDKIARRMKITDATAVRGATGLGDYARAVIVAHVDELFHDAGEAKAHLAEVITFAMRKSNYTRKWLPIELRRGEHGELIPLDEIDRKYVAEARAPKTSKRAAEREQTKAEQEVKDDEKRTAKSTKREDEVRKRNADDDDAVRMFIAKDATISKRRLRAEVASHRACGTGRADAAIERVRGAA